MVIATVGQSALENFQPGFQNGLIRLKWPTSLPWRFLGQARVALSGQMLSHQGELIAIRYATPVIASWRARITRPSSVDRAYPLERNCRPRLPVGAELVSCLTRR